MVQSSVGSPTGHCQREMVSSVEYALPESRHDPFSRFTRDRSAGWELWSTAAKLCNSDQWKGGAAAAKL